MKKILSVIILFCFALSAWPALADGTGERLRGRILLQVESFGQAWYVDPENGERYFMGRPADAFSVMRSLGLGISNKDLAKIALPGEANKDEALARRLAGKIVLQVEKNGEAYYIDPINRHRYFMGRPADAFALMRSKGLGITNVDLEKITVAKASLPPKPKVELFVMSLCPYALQMEKGIVPVVRLLGDKIDFKIEFVNYAMHGQTEISENTSQHCLQKLDQDKYYDYLNCFTGSGVAATCLDKSGIDQATLDICTAAADEEYSITANYEDEGSWLYDHYPRFNIDSAAVAEYSVSGSPELVINGKKVSVARDSASLLAKICESFSVPPAECLEVMSAVAPSTGFGYIGSNTSGSCN